MLQEANDKALYQQCAEKKISEVIKQLEREMASGSMSTKKRIITREFVSSLVYTHCQSCLSLASLLFLGSLDLGQNSNLMAQLWSIRKMHKLEIYMVNDREHILAIQVHWQLLSKEYCKNGLNLHFGCWSHGCCCLHALTLCWRLWCCGLVTFECLFDLSMLL